MTRSLFRASVGAAVVLSMLAVPAAAQEPPRPARSDLLTELGSSRVERHSATGHLRFVSGSAARPAATSAALGRPSTPQAAAQRFMVRYGSLFGIADASRNLRVARSERAIGGNTFVRYQQLHRGVPVLGGELAVQVDGAGNVISANGEASPDLGVDVTPAVTSAAAKRNASSAIAKARGVARGDLTASVPSLWIYDPALLGGRALPFTRLVWRMDVTNRAGDMRELVLIDAARGNVALHFDQIAEAKNRLTCDANSTATKYPCTTAQAARTETSGASAVADVNNAHVFSGHTYDFFFNRFGRDSLDGAGMALKSTVRFCPDSFNCPYQNAFWDGSQMVYGAGFADADDVVGHELAHGVTDHTSSLFYYYQSGAINEALSDIFGEFVDLANGADGPGGSGAGVRWLLGEDLSIGAIRDMENPPLTDQPDKMTSSLYW
ncbi:MAG: M4 family metallopeptidase, partial [Chloroflexota bacterium]|nr:M4 family metallopeptidase [Chloroflexota bacterium]